MEFSAFDGCLENCPGIGFWMLCGGKTRRTNTYQYHVFDGIDREYFTSRSIECGDWFWSGGGKTIGKFTQGEQGGIHG